MPRIITIESFREFSERQGCFWAFSNRLKCYVFANGAKSNGVEQHSEPPASELKRLQLIHEHYAAALEHEEASFDAFRKHSLDHAALAVRYPDSIDPPRPDTAAQLREGHQHLDRLRAKLREVESQLDQLACPPEVLEERRRRLAAREAMLSDIRSAV